MQGLDGRPGEMGLDGLQGFRGFNGDQGKTIFSLESNLRMLRFMGSPSCFFISFTKGDNCHKSLFATLDNEAFPKIGSALKGKNLLLNLCSLVKGICGVVKRLVILVWIRSA